MVIALDSFALALVLAAAATLLFIGAAAAWASANFARRIAGLVVAMTGAVAASAALGAPLALTMAALAVLFAHAVLGVAALVRAQEAYGLVETPDIDAADESSEPTESAT